jgi:two-component system NarL family sensor kinase
MGTVSSHITVFIIITTGIVFLLALLIVSLLYLYQQRQIAYDRNMSGLRLDFEKNLLKTKIEIQEQTFENIAREIHDNINHSLTLAKLNLNTLSWEEIAQTRASIGASVELIGSAISHLSDLSKTMNPEVITNLGLSKALQFEVNKLTTMAHLDVDYTVGGELVFLCSEKELITFRIVQESFNNIIKHAKASKVWLHLEYCAELLTITVRDNGVGFVVEDASGKGSAGLINMRARAKSFGGNFIVSSEQQKGTEILLTIPYK